MSKSKAKWQELLSIARMVLGVAAMSAVVGAILALLVAARMQRPKNVVNAR